MAADYIREFLDATKHLKDAADQLKKSAGGKPIGQSLIETAKSMLAPLVANDVAGRRTISEMYGFDPKGYRDGSKPGPPPQPPDAFKSAQHDMIRALVRREQDRGVKGKTDPTKSNAKPTRFQRIAVVTAKRAGAVLRRTRVGRVVSAALKTKGGQAVAGFVTRAAGSVAARAGIAAGSGAAAGGGAAAAGAAAVPVIGWVVAALVLVGTALYAFGKVVTNAADEQLEAMRQYEKVSAGMATVFAQADARDILRNMERGDRLAPSAQSLSNADQKLKDNSSEIVVLVERIKNDVIGFLEDKVGAVLKPVNDAAKTINKWFGGENEELKIEPFGDFLDRVYQDSQRAVQAGDRWHQGARADRR